MFISNISVEKFFTVIFKYLYSDLTCSFIFHSFKKVSLLCRTLFFGRQIEYLFLYRTLLFFHSVLQWRTGHRCSQILFSSQTAQSRAKNVFYIHIVPSVLRRFYQYDLKAKYLGVSRSFLFVVFVFHSCTIPDCCQLSGAALYVHAAVGFLSSQFTNISLQVFFFFIGYVISTWRCVQEAVSC